MLLYDLFRVMEGQDDWEHQRALNRTGFWGAQGAGAIPFAQQTKRFLIAHRSQHVEQPGDWGTWGGAIDRGENPEQAARREIVEEAGYHGEVAMVPLYVFQKDTFRYSNFLAIVEHEFKPAMDWETQGFRWCEFGKWPKPLHFGLQAVFNDPASIMTIQKVLQQI